jgi:UDP-glucose 4-epimerase
VREVIRVCREVTGREITAEEGPRRAGDPAVLVASSELIKAELGWRATHGLEAMVADAWQCLLARAGR